MGFNRIRMGSMRIQTRIRIQGVKPMRIDADPDTGHKKLMFYMTNILKVGNGSKNIPTKVQKPFGKQETRFIR